jgi:hypothetical protein
MTNRRVIVSPRSDERMARQKIDGQLDFRLNAFGAPRRVGLDVLKDGLEVVERRPRVANPHRPRLAQAACTS